MTLTSCLRRAALKTLLWWSLPALYMISTRVIEVIQVGWDYTYLAP